MNKLRSIVDFLSSKDMKIKYIKLSVLLSLIFLTFFNNIFGYIAASVCAVFILFEFSVDSIIWLLLTGTLSPYIKTGMLQVLLAEFIVIMSIQFIKDIKCKKIDCNNWYFKTISILFVTILLLLLLPLSRTYSFISQLSKVTLFGTLFFAIIYIKQIKVKELLKIFSLAIGVTCFIFLIAQKFGGGDAMLIPQKYSKGFVERFAIFNLDPNFTGAIILCAVLSWYILYKNKVINNYLYFGLFSVFVSFMLMTISKAVILVFVMFGLFVLFDNIVTTIRTRNVKNLIELVYYLGAVLLACLICWKYVDAMYQRMFVKTQEYVGGGVSNSVSGLTTGRSDIWKIYLNAIFNDWRILIFGVGVKAPFINGTAAHCMPIDYLYRYGVIICAVLVAIFIVAVIPYLKKVKIYNFAPMILISTMFCSLGTISVKHIYVFVIILLTLCYNAFKKDNTNNISLEKVNE